MLITQPDAVIFDLDGTLLDTEPLYTQAAQQVVSQFGKKFTLDLKRRIMGGDSRMSAAIVIRALDLPIDIDDYLEQRERILIELFANADEISGAGGFVDWLACHKLLIGLATSSSQKLCGIKLSNRTWSGQFDKIVCGDDSRLANSKPAPDIFLLCAADLDVNPTKCLVFEDSPNGVTAGLAAGMQDRKSVV